jgi:glycosyltransferase involved in cell wall biosynthesis
MVRRGISGGSLGRPSRTKSDFMSPKVTVVIPVFNRPAPIRRAIESVLAQTCQDFEIIVVDDASTDGTVASVASFTDPRIRLIRQEHNRGASAARNAGIRAGSGTYVAFLDSDDVWLPTKLQRQLEVFERSSERLGLVYVGKQRIFADGTVEVHIPSPCADLSRALLTVNVVGETSVGMARRSALDAIGGFDETLPASQDMDLWLRLSERFLAEVVPEALVKVAKGGDAGRITASAAGMTRGRELFRKKHGEKMRQIGELHRYLRDSGWVYQREARDPVSARRCYLESLAVKPIAPLTVALLLTASLPLSWLDTAAHWKHGIVAFLQSAYIRVAPGERSLQAPVPDKGAE